MIKGLCLASEGKEGSIIAPSTLEVLTPISGQFILSLTHSSIGQSVIDEHFVPDSIFDGLADLPRLVRV